MPNHDDKEYLRAKDRWNTLAGFFQESGKKIDQCEYEYRQLVLARANKRLAGEQIPAQEPLPEHIEACRQKKPRHL